jgi:hypothetical protein
MRKWAVVAGIVVFVAFTMGLLVLSSSKVNAADGNSYVGVEKCKGCHSKEYNDYQKRKFTKAWNVLVMRGKDKDGECLKCHATGYGEGGFVSDDVTPNLKYKQCEACHGPGGKHANNPGDPEAMLGMKNYVREKDVCIKCHVCMKTHKDADF